MKKPASKSELAIVIPAKNEAKNITRLLDSISAQDYAHIRETPVVVADAHSEDTTRATVLGYAPGLNVSVVDGGMPSVGRNAGARSVDAEYILFIDADIELRDRTLIRRALETARQKNYSCVTARIRCAEGTKTDRMVYAVANIVVRISKYFFPFATGMFMLFKKFRFDELGGFDETITLSEDFVLTRNLRSNEFGMVSAYFDTSNRRFVKTGHWKMALIILGSILHAKSIKYFRRTGKNYFDR